MALILHIESATTMCSVSLGQHNECLDLIEINDGYSHAENLAPFVDDILKRNQFSLADIDAIAISEGPGSYTGLRIGVSLAKGLCYGADKPLIAISTLQQMCLHPEVQKVLASSQDVLLCPMLDARRMEVYTALYTAELETKLAPTNKILDERSYLEYLDSNKVVFFGNGSDKFKEVCEHPNAIFVDNVWPSAQNMIQLSATKYEAEAFEDVAYFEPFYLKEFQGTTPKKLL